MTDWWAVKDGEVKGPYSPFSEARAAFGCGPKYIVHTLSDDQVTTVYIYPGRVFVGTAAGLTLHGISVIPAQREAIAEAKRQQAEWHRVTKITLEYRDGKTEVSSV